MSKSVGVKKKSIWRDKASWELLMLCVPTLLAFTLFHYEPPARIWSCSQPERQSNLTSTIQRANITSKTLAPAAYPSDNRTHHLPPFIAQKCRKIEAFRPPLSCTNNPFQRRKI